MMKIGELGMVVFMISGGILGLSLIGRYVINKGRSILKILVKVSVVAFLLGLVCSS